MSLLDAQKRVDPEKQLLLDRYLKIRKDPIEFLKAVRTLDEVDKNAPVKHFPWEKEYVQWYCRAWQRENFMAIPKSRRMMASWLNIALFLWDAMFYQGRNHAFVSKKEEDSDELVKRAKFIYEHLDYKILPKELLPAMDYKFCTLLFPEMNSRIRGFPSGADQLRQFTFSRILGDECAFWPDAQEMYSASVPTLQGGGQLVMISSPGPGFFKRLVFDQLDHQNEFDPETVLAGQRKSPMPGLNIWRNPKNKFFVFELHYTADPEKRKPEFIQAIKPTMPIRDWQREYELQWDSYDGLPVYGDWMKATHLKRGLEPQIGLPLLRGWDFGLTPACVVAQLQGRTLVVLKEFTELNMGADRFSDLVLPQCSILFPQWDTAKNAANQWIDFIDPAGENRDQSAEGSCARILDSKGLKCIPGAVAFEDRRKAVEKFLTTFDQDGPNFQIDPQGCPLLVRGFEGGYRYPETVLGKEPQVLRPVKDEHSHPHDALQYVATGVLKQPKKRPQGTRIPRVGFSFGKVS